MLTLKVTERCNSSCSYCSVRRSDGAHMGSSVLAALFTRVDEYLREDPLRDLELLWHGGEPLILGTRYFAKAAELLESRCASTRSRIRNLLQTNLTALREDFLDVFARLDIRSVGTSFDPEPHVRGPGRKVDSERYARRWMRGLRILERNGIAWGINYVVTRKSLTNPRAVFFFLTNLSPTGRVTLSPVQIDSERGKELEITVDEYVHFLGEVFPVWRRRPHRYPELSPFSGLHRPNTSDPRALQQVHHLTIAPDGAVGHSGRGSGRRPIDYGHVDDLPLAELFAEDVARREEMCAARARRHDCPACPVWRWCGAGRVQDAFSQNERFSTECEWCDGKRRFVERYVDPTQAAARGAVGFSASSGGADVPDDDRAGAVSGG